MIDLKGKKVCLVVPCFNEEARLDLCEFAKYAGDGLYFLFVDDGSMDRTLEILEKNSGERFLVFVLKSNSGKAEAVRQGMLHLKSLPIFKDLEWVGYWDADLATPIPELENYFKFKELFMPDADAVFGSRIIRLGSRIERKFSRHLTGRLFAIFAKILFELGTYDSQCGAKIFRKEMLDKAFGDKFISKWIFDIEIILRLRGSKIIECPLTQWKDVAGSKLMKPGNIVRVFTDLFRLWKHYPKKNG